MDDYYCRKCAFELGLIPEYIEVPVDPLGTEYQLGKFIKHTFPTEFTKIHSIFSDPSVSKYLQYVVNTSASGCVEIDGYNRTSLIFAAGETTGFTYVNGTMYRPDNAVRLVYPLDDCRMHAFSTSGSVIPRFCLRCGAPIIT